MILASSSVLLVSSHCKLVDSLRIAYVGGSLILLTIILACVRWQWFLLFTSEEFKKDFWMRKMHQDSQRHKYKSELGQIDSSRQNLHLD